jgi:hypothetical protein
LFEGFYGERVASQEVMEEKIANCNQRKAMAFLFRGEANIRAAHGDGVPNGREEKDGQVNEQSETN